MKTILSCKMPISTSTCVTVRKVLWTLHLTSAQSFLASCVGVKVVPFLWTRTKNDSYVPCLGLVMIKIFCTWITKFSIKTIGLYFGTSDLIPNRNFGHQNLLDISLKCLMYSRASFVHLGNIHWTLNFELLFHIRPVTKHSPLGFKFSKHFLSMSIFHGCGHGCEFDLTLTVC